MSDQKNNPAPTYVNITGGSASNNGGNGYTIRPGVNVTMQDVIADGNKGHGVDIGSDDREAVMKALELLKKELVAGDQQHALAIIDESEKELAKPNPNKGVLSGFVGAIKRMTVGAIDIAPKIPAAIEAVENAIALLPF
jgi:hypothetical protein